MNPATQSFATSSLTKETTSAQAIDALQSVELPDDLQIPSLPTSLTEFLDASNRDDYDVKELGKIVEHDPGLTVDLLKCVNCAAVGSASPVKTPTEALVRLGIPRSRTFLIAAGMRGAVLAHESRLMNCRNFWNESLRRALFARTAAIHLKLDVDLAYMGGLLQDFLLPVLTNQYDSQYIEFMKDAAPQGMTLIDWEADTFGWDHAVAGAYVARKWNMPDDLLLAIMLHHRMDLALESPDAETFKRFPVTLAALLPDQLHQVPGGVERLIKADGAMKLFHLDQLSVSVDKDLAQIAEKHDTPLLLSPIIQKARESLQAVLV